MKVVSLAVLISLLLIASSFQAQTNPPSPSKDDKTKTQKRIKGSITGQVVSEGGEPLLDAEVTISPFDSPYTQGNVTAVDREGKFRVDNLSAGSYTVRASVAGYVLAKEEERRNRKPYHLGDSVTLLYTKGSVITGTVTDSDGEPVIATNVRAIRVKDSDNRKTTEQGYYFGITDDRGVYRIFGLPPGVYLVSLSGSNDYYTVGGSNNSPPIFYPSSPYESAAEVTVQAGQEMNGVDIRFRELAGHNVSGRVTNTKSFAGESSFTYLSVTLRYMNGVEVAGKTVREDDAKSEFSFDEIADGEYEIRASLYEQSKTLAASEWQKVTVKGADVGGIIISLAKMSSLTGKIVLEKSKEEKKDAAVCENKRNIAMEEFLVQTPRDDSKESPSKMWTESTFTGFAPDENGTFTAKNMVAGKRRFIIKLPDENLFVRSITAPPLIKDKPPQDIGRNGIIIKSGEQAKDISVNISEGAAKISGKVIPQQEGAGLPDNLLVHIVPAEKEAVDDVVRYFETAIESDESFSVSNIPPGKYFVLLRPMKAGDEKEAYRRPVAWDDIPRAKLRKDAETANQTVELTPCKRINDFVLKLK